MKPDDFWNNVASRIGYDFSKMRVKKIGVDAEKEFSSEVNALLDTSKYAIDIGTSDGRFPLMIANKLKKIVAIDLSENMIKAANENLHKTDIKNVEFMVADASNLHFDNETFDIAISRRGPATSSIKFLKEVY